MHIQISTQSFPKHPRDVQLEQFFMYFSQHFLKCTLGHSMCRLDGLHECTRRVRSYTQMGKDHKRVNKVCDDRENDEPKQGLCTSSAYGSGPACARLLKPQLLLVSCCLLGFAEPVVEPAATIAYRPPCTIYVHIEVFFVSVTD